MWLIRGVLGHRKKFVKKLTEIHFSIFIENRILIWNLFFDLIMRGNKWINRGTYLLSNKIFLFEQTILCGIFVKVLQDDILKSTSSVDSDVLYEVLVMKI